MARKTKRNNSAENQTERKRNANKNAENENNTKYGYVGILHTAALCEFNHIAHTERHS